MKSRLLVPFLLLLTLALPATAQKEHPDKSRFRVEVTFSETVDKKPGSAKSFVMLINDGAVGQIRTGSRVPIPSEKGVQYMDVGFNLDCRLEDHGDSVQLAFTAESSTLAEGPGSPLPAPVVRSNRTQVTTSLTLGKKTMIISADDVNSARQGQVEVTITRIS